MENIYISSNIEFENLNNSIKLSMKKSAGHMIQLGYLLRKMMESRLWESYYTDFDSYLREDLGMDYTMANRFINANKRFSVSGNSENIDPAYEGYSQSALIEMLALPEESMGKVSEKNTVREIREIAKAEKEKRGPSDEDVMCFYEEFAKEYDMNRSTLKENLINLYGKRYTCHGGGILDFKCSPRGIQIGESEEVTWAQLVKRINSLCPFREEEKPISTEEDTGQQAEDVLEGQMHITEYPELIHDDTVIDVECMEMAEENEIATSQFSEKLLSPYGLEESVYPPDSLIATAGCGNKHDCFDCGQTGCEIRKEERYCVTACLGNPFPCDTLIKIDGMIDKSGIFEESDVFKGCQFIDHELSFRAEGNGRPVPCCKKCEINDCIYRCDRAKESVREYKNPMDDDLKKNKGNP